MSWNSKVVWSEGMFLQPQHLQQQDRFLQMLVEQRTQPLRPFAYGFSALHIDEQSLSLGKIVVQSARGVMPDGTPFAIPGDEEPPVPLDVPPEARNALVVLALPLRRSGMPEVDGTSSGENLARYRPVELEVRDSNSGMAGAVPLQVGKLRLRLVLESDVTDAFTTLGVARIVERRADNQLVLDRDYIPPCQGVRVSSRLAGFIDEILGLLHQRGEALGSRLSQPGASGVAEIADFLMLQLINRCEPLFSHLTGLAGLHPEDLFREVLQLAGELATFTRQGKRPVSYPGYRHDRLKESFFPLMEDLRRSLSLVIDSHAVPLTLEERRFGVRVAMLPDPTLLKSAAFVLAVNAQLPPEGIRSSFPASVKIAPVEKLVDVVNLQLPGIGLRPLPVAPRQLPFHAGFTYFELDRSSEYFAMLTTSGGIGIFVAGEFPGLELEFWAIRG
jgi:type VI secretion system protein ImpJ